ncbi:MAG: GNAT family N-acetyltransferase [Spirochaetales bacterium]|nr:GNAT family N-acetyltransferase [Spirochaetales bacterium]
MISRIIENCSHYEIQPFEMKNIPLILDVVVPMWSMPTWEENYKQFAVEYIIRNNFFENDMHYQLVEKSPADSESCKVQQSPEFCSMAFFARKTDICKSEKWFECESKKFTPDLINASKMSKAYIELMDEKVRAFMNEDDIQLTLYVSRKKGCGSKLLNELCKELYKQGYKNLYLWTDCDCNWEWYTGHGYELVSKEAYEPFSSESEDYLTYIFKKKL